MAAPRIGEGELAVLIIGSARCRAADVDLVKVILARTLIQRAKGKCVGADNLDQIICNVGDDAAGVRWIGAAIKSRKVGKNNGGNFVRDQLVAGTEDKREIDAVVRAIVEAAGQVSVMVT